MDNLDWSFVLEVLKVLIIPVVVITYKAHKSLKERQDKLEGELTEHKNRLNFLDEDRKIQNQQLETLQVLTATVAKLDGKLDVFIKK